VFKADDRETRMNRGGLAVGAAALLAVLNLGAAEPGPARPYLTAEATPDATDLLGPPPPEGSGTKAGDVATYQATRKLEGGARWALAARDAEYGPAVMMADFSCAVGVRLTPDNFPALLRLFSRAQLDSGRIMGRAKIAYRRPRPFVELGGKICVAPDPGLAKSYSYPSGHSTYGWTAGLILAQVAPDRAATILARARAYGESRVVCGVHYESDVAAGRATGSALFSALQTRPDFQADVAAASADLARARVGAGAAPDAGACKAEADASATPVW
jgi:acid phosphatase (class A)